MTKQLQDLVPDLSICQDAKKKGVEIESVHYWNNFYGDWEVNDASYYKLSKDCTPAPLTDEILEKLPFFINYKDKKTQLIMWKGFNDYFAGYQTNDNEREILFYFEDKKLSNALLKLAIRLKEEGII